MTTPNIDNTLNDLGKVLRDLSAARQSPIDSTTLINSIPKRGLSGDHINGGTVINFASVGIKDLATRQQIMIKDDAVSMDNLAVNKIKGNLSVEADISGGNLNLTGKITAASIEVKEIKADLRIERTSPLEFKNDKDSSVYGKGLLWSGLGYTKQLVLAASPDRLFSTESLDLAENRSYYINNVKVLSQNELGPGITKSSLRELGRLKGLIVDGSLSVNQYLYYNASTDRLGLGIEDPNSAFSVAEDGIEVMLGTADFTRGMVGTFASNDFDIVTDNTTRISVKANGNVHLGHKDRTIQATVHGKLSVGVNTPDPNVDLHVNGPIKFDGRIHKYAPNFPDHGAHKQGDIVWNSEPRRGNYIGWICIKAGDPGEWVGFGAI